MPRPATTVLLLRPSVPGEPNSTLEVFMVVRHQAIDSFSGALVFPGGKLEDADGDARLRARCGHADKITPEELKFRVAGVREAFEECGILLARKRGERAVIAAADLKGIEDRWRKKLAKDEASIVDLVEAEDLELATDMMVPYAHWITPTFAPKRFDTWFFLAEAPEDQIALHDGSESVELGVDRRASEAIDEATAGKRTLVHATLKNLELLAEGKTVAGAIAAASQPQGRHRPALGRDARRQALPAHPARRRLPQPVPRTAADGGEVSSRHRARARGLSGPHHEKVSERPEARAPQGFRRPEPNSTFLAAMIKCVSRVPAGRAKAEA